MKRNGKQLAVSLCIKEHSVSSFDGSRKSLRRVILRRSAASVEKIQGSGLLKAEEQSQMPRSKQSARDSLRCSVDSRSTPAKAEAQNRSREENEDRRHEHS